MYEFSQTNTNHKINSKRNGGSKIEHLDFYNWEHKMNQATE